MTREQVEAAVGHYLRGEFGKLLVVRELSRVRHVDSNAWKVRIVAPLRTGDVEIAELEVDEKGFLSPLLDMDGVVEVLRAGGTEDADPPSIRHQTLDLARLDFDDERSPSSTPPSSLRGADSTTINIRESLEGGDLKRAQSLFPRLLTDPDQRGRTLVGMADVERRLGNVKLALEYIEAAAREFADRFDIDGLEDAAQMTLEIVGEEAFLKTKVHELLGNSRARLRPLASVLEAPALSGAPEDQRAWLDMNAELVTLKRGDFLVHEGDPSRAVYVIKSGVLAVLLEKPDGGTRLIRCCFPGWLLGESSVLVEGDPRCSASLRAEQLTEVYRLEAALLANVMSKSQALRERIAQAKQIHRIDSFFAMHEATGQLDALVRDEMLACLQRIQTFDEDTLLFPAGEVPGAACLVARGEIVMHHGWELDSEPVSRIGVDGFANVRDTIHGIASTSTTLATAGTTVAFFDGKKLRALAERSPPNVSAVLERLG
ncbi:MAG: Crp/Fnr family transcriptional regulator [Polyangiales bacterium]